MPKGTALGLSIACFLGAAAYFVAEFLWVAVPLFAVSVVFDLLFVMASRGERRSEQ